MTTQTLSTLSAAKQALLERRLKAASRADPGLREISRRPDPGCAPLSHAQRQMWVIDQMTPGNPAGNLPYGYRLRGPLDRRTLEASFNTVIERHEILRTTFHVRDDEPIQRVHSQLRIEVRAAGLQHLSVGEREAALQGLATQESTRPFDLSCLPLIRVSLFTLADAENVLLVNLHHIIADGISAALLLNEVAVLYQALAAGRTASLDEPAVQYGDFAHWQQQRTLQGDRHAAQAAFWARRLEGNFPVLDLPSDHPRPPRKSFRGANAFFDVPAALVSELKNLAARERCTLFMALLAAFQALLQRYSGATDMVIVAPVANRSGKDLQAVIGNFLNLLPLRCDVAGDPTFIELLRRSRETTLDAFSNADVPLETMLEHARMEGTADGTPMLQTMLQVLPPARLALDGLEASSFRFDLGFAQLDLSLHFYEEESGACRGRLEYCTDLFRSETMAAFVASFEDTLRAMASDPTQRVSCVPMRLPQPRAPLARQAPDAAPGGSPVSIEPPRTKTEELVLAAFRSVLKRANFGVRHDFFHLGGHSLAAARLIFQLRRESGVDLPLRLLLERPTPEKLAEAIDMLAWTSRARQAGAATSGDREEIEL